jgi:hypothetical protein
MKIIPAESLPALSQEIKRRVAEGVYSLYTVEKKHNEHYALIFGEDVFLLSETGTVSKQLRRSNFDTDLIRDAVSFVISCQER